MLNRFQSRSFQLVSRRPRESAEAVLELDKGRGGKRYGELFLLFSQTISSLPLDYTYGTSISGLLVLVPIVGLRFFGGVVEVVRVVDATAFVSSFNFCQCC
jgi:hypothetical protein